MKDICSHMPHGSLDELVVQTSSGVRLSNIFIANSFEEVEGYIGLGQPIC